MTEDDYVDHDDELDEEPAMDQLKELEEFFSKPPAVVIGTGKNAETDLAEWTDPDEARYNAKYGLDKNGDPLAVHKVLEMRGEDLYSMTLSEGYELLDGDGDDEGAGLYKANDAMNPDGFNQW